MPSLLSDSVRAFLEEPRFGVMATINPSGTPQLTVMWYALEPDDDVVVLNATRGLLKERNLRREPRYIGQRLGSRRWEVIKGSDRIGIRMRIERVHARGVQA
jgi:predicted pyridoxine 5'-phosphate oxidase superfamily flavin-nucleotide-binding protein